MSIETAGDREAYVSVFGVDAVVDGVTIKAIWDDPHFETMAMSTSTPMLTCVASDIPSVAFGQTVSVASVSFVGTIADVQADGTGIVVLILKET